MITNLAQLKALEVEYREMLEFGTVLESEYAEVVAMRKLIEDVRGVARHIADRPAQNRRKPRSNFQSCRCRIWFGRATIVHPARADPVG